MIRSFCGDLLAISIPFILCGIPNVLHDAQIAVIRNGNRAEPLFATGPHKRDCIIADEFARRTYGLGQPAYVGCASKLHSRPRGTPPFDASGEVGRLAIIDQALGMRFRPELLVELNELVGICASVDGGVERSA
jgi:hypothetical protein